MTNVVGLIVEYNPLHNGHAYHFQQAKKLTKADASVVVMSGNFLQRGEPALVSKWTRAEMALEMGADLVIELPYVYAAQHARHFAFGAVSILNHLPFVTHLCFGSESGCLEELKKLATCLVYEPEPFKRQVKMEIKKGKSYPKAFSDALSTLEELKHLDPKLYSQPNNILGLYYIISLMRLKSKIEPVTVQRIKAAYHDQTIHDHHISSATAIREAIFSQLSPNWEQIRPYVPSYTFDLLMREVEQGRGPIRWASYFDYLQYKILSYSPEELAQIYEMEEGIEHRLKTEIVHSCSFEHFMTKIKTKRYTWNRIQRILVHTFIHLKKGDIEQLKLELGAPYIRILGFSNRGRQLLGQWKKRIGVPYITNMKKDRPPMLEWDIQASALYQLGYLQKKSLKLGEEFKQSPLMRKGK